MMYHTQFCRPVNQNISISSHLFISGIGEQIIIKGAAKTIVDYFSNNCFDINDQIFLDELYRPLIDEQKMEFGFLSVCVFKG